jgi:glycosyltransferase involved in cell wall biosynthesis
VISVVIPVLNPDRRQLAQAVDSVLRQSTELELIVVEEIDAPSLDEFFADHDDRRIRRLTNPKRNGLGAALNFGIANARGSLIARMDADDIAEPDRFAKQLAMFEADPSLSVAGSQLTIIDEAGQPIATRTYPTAHDDIARALTRYNCLAHSSVMFRKKEIERTGGYAEGIMAEDYDLWCRLLRAGARFANHREALVRYRFHRAGLKQRTVHSALRATIEVKTRNFGATLGFRARARMAAERALTLVPESVVLRLFAATSYRPLRRVK